MFVILLIIAIVILGLGVEASIRFESHWPDLNHGPLITGTIFIVALVTSASILVYAINNHSPI